MGVHTLKRVRIPRIALRLIEISPAYPHQGRRLRTLHLDRRVRPSSRAARSEAWWGSRDAGDELVSHAGIPDDTADKERGGVEAGDGGGLGDIPWAEEGVGLGKGAGGSGGVEACAGGMRAKS